MRLPRFRSTTLCISQAQIVGLVILFALAPGTANAQITFGQLDTFSSGTMGWQQGAASPNPPTVVTTGGPAGAGDAYLSTTSSGAGGAGARMIMFNTSQWTGNFTAAGVTQITADMANFGTTQLQMRVAFRGGPNSSQYTSTTALILQPNSGWQHVTFDLIAGSLTQLSGTDSVSAALGSVTELRILSSNAPSFNGDTVAASLGTDNILATSAAPVPEPAMLPVGLLSIAALVYVYGRPRVSHQPQSEPIHTKITAAETLSVTVS